MYNLIPREFDNFDKYFNSFFTPALARNTPIDRSSLVKNTDDEYLVVMEIPGVPSKNVEINVDNRVLKIKAFVTKEETNGLIEKNFERSWTLPTGVSVDDISAHVENGLLSIKLPKKEEHRVKMITVST